MTARREPKRWERQIGETAKSYEAFCIYRDMGTGRDLAKVAEQINKSVTLCRHWSTKWDWKDRVEAWVDRLDDVKRTAMEGEVKDMAKRHAQLAKSALDLISESFEYMDPKVLARRPATIAQLMEIAHRVERTSMGVPTTITKTESQVEITNGDKSKEFRQSILNDPAKRDAMLELIEQIAGEDEEPQFEEDEKVEVVAQPEEESSN